MQQKYYLDACIWRDYFENRSDRFRPLGEWAIELINNIIRTEDIFVFSDHLINELEKYVSSEKISNLLSFIPSSLIIYVKVNKKHTRAALEIKNKFKIPFGDALHFVLAKEENAIMVSRDQHFWELQKMICVKKPEDLI